LWPLTILVLFGCSGDGESGSPRDLSPTDLARPDRAAADLAPTLADMPPPRPDGGSNLGGPCKADHHCTAGLTCDTSLPGGHCGRSCKADGDCGGKRWGCFDGACRVRCQVRAPLTDCRAYYRCRLEGSRASCVADCTLAGCKAPLTCHKQSGLCVNPKGGTLGAACGVGIGDCTGTPNGVCLALLSNTKPYCTLACSPFTTPCPTDLPGAQCSIGDVKGEYCLFTCDTQKPQCPHKDMKCKKYGNYALCLQE